jgi:ABC-type transport system involved in cytochrome c biogenesis permease component
MTVLPIAGRELVVAARRPGTYWLRTCVATIALALFYLAFQISSAPLASSGRSLFVNLGSVLLTLAMLAGVFLTADCLAAEKREGTLGLLFLTDLKGYDVVLGKLAAHSLHAVFGLLAVFPVLALPLLMGGLGSGEFWRTMLVFIVTMYMSHGLGILQILEPSWLMVFLLFVWQPRTGRYGAAGIFAVWFALGIIIDIANINWAAFRLPHQFRTVAAQTRGAPRA